MSLGLTHTLLNIKQIINKDLQYSSENLYSIYFVITDIGKYSRKEYVYVCIYYIYIYIYKSMCVYN